MAVSFQCMTKFTTNKNNKKNVQWENGGRVCLSDSGKPMQINQMK